jgi:hypothetical protein
MVSSISRAANRQNTVQLADFSANDPFHQQIETLANTTWLDDGNERRFYERARGSYLAAGQKASFRKSDQTSFQQQSPKHRRLSKLDVARYLSAWSGLPDKVCLGGQENFQILMQRLKDELPPPLDQVWFKRLIAMAVLYRAAEKKIRKMKFPTYGAQITAYIVSGLSHRAGGRIDFDGLWSKYHRVTFHLRGVTRFMDHYPHLPGDISNFSIDSAKMEHIIESSVAPAACAYLYSVPFFCWSQREEVRPGFGHSGFESRRETGIRILMDRGWNSQGDDELLAILLPVPQTGLLPEAGAEKPFKSQDVVSR